MTVIAIGYAHCSTNRQDFAAQKAALQKLGVRSERVYPDHGMMRTNQARATSVALVLRGKQSKRSDGRRNEDAPHARRRRLFHQRLGWGGCRLPPHVTSVN